MNDEDAFHLLGLSLTATRSEIEDAYRRSALRLHPNKQGEGSAMAELNEARDVAIRRKNHHSLVSVRSRSPASRTIVRSPVARRSEDQHNTKREYTRQLAKYIIERRSARAEKLRRWATHAAGVSGTLSVLTAVLGPVARLAPQGLMVPALVIFALVTAAFIISSAVLQGAAADVEGYVNELDSQLSDRSLLLATLDSIQRKFNSESWTYWEFKHVVSDWALSEEMMYYDHLAEMSQPILRKIRRKEGRLKRWQRRLTDFPSATLRVIRKFYYRLLTPRRHHFSRLFTELGKRAL